ITNGYVQRRAQADTHLAALKTRRFELDATRLDLSRAALQRDELAGQFKRAQNALVEAQVALQTDVTATREKELREKIATLDAELKELRERETRLNESLAREVSDAQKLRALLVADQLSIPPALDDFIANPQLSKIPEVERRGQIANYQSAIASLGNDHSSRETLLNERVRLLREEGSQIEAEIRRLRTGDREASYEAEAPEAARLRRLLRAELGLSASDVIFLCTALQVPDESWQDAVEGVLGHNRFTLLVPPVHYDAAMRLYRERRHQENLHGVGLLDSARITQHAREARNAPPDSLAAEVQTDHPAARAFVDLVLGGYVKCDTLEGLRDHRAAVTRECFVRRNFTTTHLNPKIYRRWFIGDRAIPRRIEQLEA
ncbi:MAG: hypothetical protein AAB217_00160, partial [Chloroflexota bacterium]